MANAAKGEVGFKAGGEERVLRFDINALCDLEDRTGQPIAALFASMQDSMSIRTVRTIFAVGLGVPEEEAGEVMGEIGPAKAADLIGQAFGRAFPEAAKGPAHPRKAKPPAG